MVAFARNDVEGQHGNQLFLVLRLEQVFDRAFGKGGKCIIGRCENGEGAFALQGIDQTCGLDGGHERGEGACAHGGVDDVH